MVLVSDILVKVKDIYVIVGVVEDKIEVVIMLFEVKGLWIMGFGVLMEIYKEVGLFKDVVV